MKSQENESQKKTTYPSNPGNAKLKPFEFDPKDLEALVKQYESVDPSKDMKAAKKARTAINKKINEIKKVHTANKKIILQFKKDLEAYDLGKFEQLTENLRKLHTALDDKIKNIESGQARIDAENAKKASDLELEITNKILDARTEEEIQEVMVEINSIKDDATNYGSSAGQVSTFKTSAILKASGRLNEIKNAGGSLPDPSNVKAMDLSSMSSDQSGKHSDAELLNFLESTSIPGKGWKVMISGHTGTSIYQVDDPKAPRSLRAAIEEALVENKATTV